MVIDSTEQFFDLINTAKNHLKGQSQEDFLKKACKDYIIYLKKRKKNDLQHKWYNNMARNLRRMWMQENGLQWKKISLLLSEMRIRFRGINYERWKNNQR